MLNLKNTLDGYLKNVEVIGNTIQDIDNLKDIKSVGDKVEGQELYSISIQVDNGNGVNEVVEILSPVQLEKVGDVADRIIYKDGVWGVEKNIITERLTSNLAWLTRPNSLGVQMFVNSSILNLGVDNRAIMCNTLTVNRGINQESLDGYNQILAHKNSKYSNNLYLTVANITTIEEFGKWLDDNPTYIKYVTTDTPQFTPLPHDQQIKLRTFTGQTNISFLTEIAGQIKAQVPKSLGATVNTHTEQISNLNKELNRVKKLEESTVSTVETVSSFTPVDATSNGYFEDVKLEGKTLVNLYQNKAKQFHADYIYATAEQIDLSLIKPRCEYTLVALGSNNIYSTSICNQTATEYFFVRKLGTITLFNTPDSFNEITTPLRIYAYSSSNNKFTSGEENNVKFLILEGDHTNNPPEYFEGLMSVGQDIEEITIKSVNSDGNLFDESVLNKYITSSNDDSFILDYPSMYRDSFIYPVKTKGQHIFRYICKETIGNKNPRFQFLYKDGTYDNIHTSTSNEFKEYKRESNLNKELIGIRVIFTNSEGNWIIKKNSIMLNKGTESKPYVPYKSDKKLLLYYNEETQTWEKPVLREWDSIEKHSDGKYYYHKRSGEVVLNGSESWTLAPSTDTGFTRFYSPLKNKQVDSLVVCDTYLVSNNMYLTGDLFECIGGFSGNSMINIKLVGDITVEQLKQKLQSNPTTVVYQLAQEEVYECTNIDLMTYSGETNYIINSGAISPKSLLKVHNNISNVVKILQEKVSVLENTFIAGLRSVLAGDMYSLATILYPEDFEQNDNIENDIMVIPE